MSSASEETGVNATSSLMKANAQEEEQSATQSGVVAFTDDSYIENLFQQAEMYRNRGDLHDALEAYNKVLELVRDMKSAEACFWRNHMFL